MTVSDAWPLQQAVYTAAAAAVAAENVEIFDHIPTNPPEEFIRLEGMNIDDASWKDTERGRHRVMFTVITRPTSGNGYTQGQQRVKALLSLLHAALKDLTYGRGRMNFEYMNIEADEDGASTMGSLRYTIHV